MPSVIRIKNLPKKKLATNTKEPVFVVTSSGCWECISHGLKNGYANIFGGGHRFMWSLWNKKEIPDGMVVRHKCDNSKCCNPHHLEIGTQYDNVQDAVKRGRRNPARGSQLPQFGKIARNARPVIQLTMDGEFVSKHPNGYVDGFSASKIHSTCKGKQSQHKGYKWVYEEDYIIGGNNSCK
ncbi:HNH endonuclease signature motif containing protein [Priestia aryabhattai]|uniref:HNH endonuclease signature motif containing protein n=1 Tax=Priestia aryabhattai TaxID=412384 RepID=UPI002E21CC7D|nr:HNH endonuclease signature motif containing protein [Priestia aryabhattai]